MLLPAWGPVKNSETFLVKPRLAQIHPISHLRSVVILLKCPSRKLSRFLSSGCWQYLSPVPCLTTFQESSSPSISEAQVYTAIRPNTGRSGQLTQVLELVNTTERIRYNPTLTKQIQLRCQACFRRFQPPRKRCPGQGSQQLSLRTEAWEARDKGATYICACNIPR